MNLRDALGAALKAIRGLELQNRWRATSALLVICTASSAAAFADAPPPPPASDLANAYSHVAPYEPRFGRERPVIAVVGENSGTELTDFVLPYGILSDSGAAEVFAVATGAGSIAMWPALRIQPDFTLTSFDERFPQGADYVIVPAVMAMDKKSPQVLVEWIKAQAEKGASIVSICDGALTVARAGIFKGHRATGHWATLAKRKREYPDTDWVENTRYVADGKAISSAGVTAAIPLSLALVEAIAGTERALQVAAHIGVHEWSSEHDSHDFHLSFGVYSLAIRNWLLPTTRIGLPIADGVDEIALALTADAFSRTYRSRAYSVAESTAIVRTQHGLTLVPDRVVGKDKVPLVLRPTVSAVAPAKALDEALDSIANMYGSRTARFVALQLEYPQ